VIICAIPYFAFHPAARGGRIDIHGGINAYCIFKKWSLMLGFKTADKIFYQYVTDVKKGKNEPGGCQFPNEGAGQEPAGAPANHQMVPIVFQALGNKRITYFPDG